MVGQTFLSALSSQECIEVVHVLNSGVWKKGICFVAQRQRSPALARGATRAGAKRQARCVTRASVGCTAWFCFLFHGSASIDFKIFRVIASRFGRSSTRPGVSMLRAKNTGPLGCSTHPTHHPTVPLQPVLALNIHSGPASTIMMSLMRR